MSFSLNTVPSADLIYHLRRSTKNQGRCVEIVQGGYPYRVDFSDVAFELSIRLLNQDKAASLALEHKYQTGA